MSDDIPAGFVDFPVYEGFPNHIGPLYMCVDEARAALGFRVLPHHVNPVGICHGGAMMSVMDMAIGMAILRERKSASFVPSVNLTFDFIKPARIGDWLESEVDFVRNTRRLGFAQGLLNGPDGPVLRCSGICKLPREDDPTFGRDRRADRPA